jgi:two-component system chemotaxis sensor kinase CheA
MDTSEYMPMFLAEAQEHLQALNLAIVRLEDNPRDRDTVDEIFRIAHSMKGMSATMGFAQIARLTHEMEEVFELLRQRTNGLPRAAIDTVLACLDALSGAFDSIEADGEESLDPDPLVERLHGLVRARSAQQAAERNSEAIMPLLIAAAASGQRVLHVVAVLDEQVMMPAVRAHMVLAALGDHGEMIGGAPTVDEVEQFSGRRIEAWLCSEHAEETIAASVSNVSDVVSVDVEEFAGPQAVPDPVPVAEPTVVAPPQAAPVVAVPVVGVEAVEFVEAVEAVEAAPAKATPAKAQSATKTVRVDAERLDALMHSMGELVIHRTAVEALTSSLEIPGLQQAMQELTRSSQSLQAMVMQVRMIPVDVVFMRFPRLVRDLSGKLGKEVKLNLVGADTELDRTVVDALGDPLVHLVRNSLDHGLEPVKERLAAGKPEVGTLEIAARHAGGSVVIEVRDDGRGIDPEAIARKALERGLIDPQAAAEINMKSAVELLFAAGFSTAETANDISGRGVGMDAVRAKIRELGGEVLVDSVQGEGTTAQIRLPLTLAIVSALHVDVSGGPYAIPLDRVERTLRLADQTVRSVAGQRMLVLDDGVLQLLDGADVFGRPSTIAHQFVVIVRAGEQRLALAVDDLIGQRELVTRPLPPIVSSGEPVSGGAALADGRIALIVDCDALAASLEQSQSRARSVPETSTAATIARVAA